MADLLLTASSGLRAFQQALNVTGHNIANVNTEGYSRQRVEINAGVPQLSAGGYVGSGSRPVAINRVYQDYLSNQLNNSYTLQSKYNNIDVYSTQLNGTLGDPEMGISAGMQSVFTSWNTMANDPTNSTSPRFLLDSQALLSMQVENYDSMRNDLQDQINGQLSSSVSQVNRITSELVALNNSLGSLNQRQELPANDLLDKRDQMVKELNQYMDIKVFQNDDGTIDVYSSDGKIPLITDNRAIPVYTKESPLEKYDVANGAPVKSDKLELYIQMPGTGRETVISGNIKGGEIGGALAFRKDQLTRAEDELGLSVAGMAIAMNAQHRQGFDVAGVRGTDMFSLNATDNITYVNTFSSNTGSQSLNVSGVASPAFAYNVRFNGATYDFTNANTGAPIAGGTGVSLPQTFNGVKIDITGGTANAGDQFLINTSPTRLMPTATSYSTPTNTGNGSIMLSGAPTADFAYKFTFNGTNYDITDAYTNASVASGVALGGTYNGVTISAGAGIPAKGDSFMAFTTTDFHKGLEQNAYVDSRNGGSLKSEDITINLNKQGLSNNTIGAKNVLNDLSNSADLAQVQKQLALLQPRTYSLTFDGSFYSVSDARTGQIIPSDSSSTGTATTLRFEGLQVDIDQSTRQMKPGDKFEFRFFDDAVKAFDATLKNPDQVAYRGGDLSTIPIAGSVPLANGNNVNAANMASLQDKKLLNNNQNTFKEAYSVMAGNVGTYHKTNQISMDTQDAVNAQLTQVRDSMSGVNLNEEAANMLRFQQAYQAAARIMQASQTMFDTILGALR